MGAMKVGGIALLATLLLSSRICWIMKVGGFAVLVTLLLLSRMSGVIKVCGFAVLVTLLLSSRICGVIKLASFVVLVTLLLSSRMCSAGSMLFWEDAEPSWELEDSACGDVGGLECNSCPVNPGCRDCRVNISVCDICPQCNPRTSKTGIGQEKAMESAFLVLPELKWVRHESSTALGSVYTQFNDWEKRRHVWI